MGGLCVAMCVTVCGLCVAMGGLCVAMCVDCVAVCVAMGGQCVDCVAVCGLCGYEWTVRSSVWIVFAGSLKRGRGS